MTFEEIRKEVQQSPEIKKLESEIEYLNVVNGIFGGKIKIVSINDRNSN